MKIFRNSWKDTNWKVAILFSAFLPAFNIINNSQNRVDSDFKKITLSWLITFLFLLVSWFVNMYITYYFERVNFRRKRLKHFFTIIICNAGLLGIFFVIGVFILNDYNFYDVLSRHSNVYLFVVLKGFVSIMMIYIIQYALNADAKAQRVSLQNQMLKTENIRAQFEILRQQVNPHFLFNSLSTLRSMIRLSNKNSEEFVIKLSEIYRQLLLKSEKEVVPLKEELDFIGDYSYMLFARYEKMLSIDIDIPNNLMNLKVPTFSLQLLLENCIKHNVISKEKPLKVKIFGTSSNCLIIENNLQVRITESLPSGYGLANLVQRYALLGFPDAVDVFSDDLVFRVKLKLLDI